MEQVAELMETWTRAIEEVVRRGGDEIMGEADDTISRLDADISDLMERRLRLVQGEERTQAGRERRGNGYPAPR